MKKVIFTVSIVFSSLLLSAQSWNPYVNQGIVSPAPLLPWQLNGTGELSFNVGNTDGSTILDDPNPAPNNDVKLVITLSSGVPNNANPLLALGGTWVNMFDWTYNSGTNSYTGYQNQNIPAVSVGTITIQYKVTVNSPLFAETNGFLVNLTPPGYTNGQGNSTGDDFISSYTFTEAKDFGDAPISYGSADHYIDYVVPDNFVYLGATVDNETAYQASATANGDDVSGSDDEDGVTSSSFVQGSTATITVTGTGSARLNAWIDWNGNGSFTNPGEQILANELLTNQTKSFTITVPVTAITTAPTFARFRFGSSGLGPTGSDIKGEVEDYQVPISCADLAAPIVTVVDNCNGTSTLTASGYTGALLWSTTQTTASITVSSAGFYTVTQTVGGCTSQTGSGYASPKNPPSIPIVTVVDNCGTSTLTASGYSGTLLWSTSETTASITVSSAGLYSVTQSLGGCTSPAGSGRAAPQTAPSAPVVTLIQPTCSVPTGTIIVTAPAGMSYSIGGAYQYSTTFSSLAPGTYTVTAKNSGGCISAGTFVTILSAPDSPSAPIIGTITQPTCSLATGSVVLTGLPAGNWVIHPVGLSGTGSGTTISGLTPGIYNFSVTNADGCTSSPTSVTILSQPQPPAAPSVTVVNNCNGTSTLTASGYTGTLLWSTAQTTASITVSSAGIYTVTQTVGGCQSPAGSGTADPKTGPIAPVLTLIQPTCSSGTGTVTITAPAGMTYGYVYKLADGTYYIHPYQSSATFSSLAPGLYTFTAKNSDGCVSTGLNLMISLASTIIANNDSGSLVNGLIGGTSFVNVLVNDELSCKPATLDNVTIKFISSTHPNVTLSGTNVMVAPGTPTSTYSLTYEICDKLSGTPCDQAVVTVPVLTTPPTPMIDAINDAGSSVNSVTGGVSYTNVLVNDLLNGSPVVLADLNLSFVSSTHSGITLSGSNVVVAPGTPAGSHSLVYRICEKLNPTNCDNATVTVPVAAPSIIANDDYGSPVNGFTGGTSYTNVLVNDLLNGVPVVPSAVVTTFVGSTNPNITLSGTNVIVAPLTSAGIYYLSYRICEVSNPSNCDEAIVRVPVAGTPIIANDDSGGVPNGITGGTAVTNVLVNDLLNGLPVVPSAVITTFISSTNPKVTLSGTSVIIAPLTPSGTYYLTYRICEVLNPSNCDDAIVTVVVSAPAVRIIDAVPDAGTVNTITGGTAVPNVLVNDLLNGLPVIPSDITTTFVSTTSPNVTLIGTSVVVAPGTPAGTYYLDYRICENLNPANCDQTTVTVYVTGCIPPTISCPAPVTANANNGCTAIGVVLGTPVISDLSGNASVTNNAPSAFPLGITTVTWTVTNSCGVNSCTQTVTVKTAIIANNDSGAVINGLIGGISLANVLANDILNCNNATLNNVVLTFISSSNKDKIFLSGTSVVVLQGLATGNYTLTYQICEKGNPANCSMATVSVPVQTTVSTLLIEANNDGGSANGVTGGTAIANILSNDKLNGVILNPSQVQLSLLSSVNPNITLSGYSVIVAPNTLAGTYTLTYRICEVMNPTNCDDAIVTVTVTTPINTSMIIAVDDAGYVNGLLGGTAVVNILVNDKINDIPVTPSQVTLTLLSTNHINISLNGTSVNVGPNTPAGIYTLVYKICDVLNPASCDEAIVTITVKSGTNNDLVFTKTAIETVYSAVGDLIHYTLRITNNSSVDSYYNLLVSDPNAEIASGNPISMLAPGKQADITAVHTVTQADLDAGKVTNTATLNSYDIKGTPFVTTSNQVIVTGLQRPQITITKFAAESSYHTVGEVIHYTFELFNCGNVTATNITISDPKAVILTGNPVSSLAPRHTVTATAEHVVTQADVNAGKIANIAYAAGIDPRGKPVGDESNEVALYMNQPAKLLITKFAVEPNFSNIGDVIHYTIVVKNYRSTVMSDIVVTDPTATITSGSPIFRLASGKTTTVTAEHVVTQADLDAGRVVNVASARGRDLYDYIDKAVSNEVTVFAKQSPLLSLTKTADETSYRQIGDLIHYNHVIKNNGNIKITGITLTDPGTIAAGSYQIASLNPGESASIKTMHTISQGDLNLGVVEKTASISGYDGNSESVRITSNTVTVKGIQYAQLATTLTAAEDTYSLEGDMIHYTIKVKNTGNVTLTNVVITDAAAGLMQGNPIPGMAPGEISVVSFEHMATKSDLAAGQVTNMATATGYNPGGEKVSNPSDELTIVASQSGQLIVTKIAQESTYAKVGEVIHYIVTVKNRGKVPVSNMTVEVPDAILSGNPVVAHLPSSASVTMLAIQTVTQADIDAGLINSEAKVSGKYPNGTAYNLKSNPVTVYSMQNPQLNTSFSSSQTSFTGVGEVINYSILVTNTGNVSLTDIGLSSQGGLALDGNPINLAPGKSAEIPALYTVTLADLNVGRIVKSVHATGIDPKKGPVNVTSNEVAVLGLQNPGLSTIASAMETSYRMAGEVIHYKITVKNTGNVSIISTAVTDPNAVVITARPNTILLPGESFTAVATHTVTKDDVNAGVVVSVAKAEGFDLNGNTITKHGNKVVVVGLQNPELVVENSASKLTFKKVGDVIDYSIKVTNLGNISIFNLGITDPNAVVSLQQPVPVLGSGESTMVSAHHVVTQADMNAGFIENLPTAAGFDLKGKTVERSGDKLTINGWQNHELATATVSSVTTYKQVGDEITFTVLVRNTGNVTMNVISITDTKELLKFSDEIASLDPGESVTVVSNYKVTIDDINAGKIVTSPLAVCYDSSSQKFSYISNDVTVQLAIENFNLSNFPNPFAYETTIVFDLPEKGEVSLKVFDVTGREVGEVEQKEFNAGRNYVNWKVSNAQKGIYILRMIHNGHRATRVMSKIN